jgi:hypothetical protein
MFCKNNFVKRIMKFLAIHFIYYNDISSYDIDEESTYFYKNILFWLWGQIKENHKKRET